MPEVMMKWHRICHLDAYALCMGSAGRVVVVRAGSESVTCFFLDPLLAKLESAKLLRVS